MLKKALTRWKRILGDKPNFSQKLIQLISTFGLKYTFFVQKGIPSYISHLFTPTTELVFSGLSCLHFLTLLEQQPMDSTISYKYQVIYFLFHGIAHFSWALSFALVLFLFEFSILEVFIILSPKKQIFQDIWFRSSMGSRSYFIASRSLE